MHQNIAVSIQNLSKTFNSQPTISFNDFDLKKGSSLLILGPSGSGKSTLLNLLAGFRKPDTGKVHYGETPFFDLSKSEQDVFRAKNMGFVFQASHLIKALSVKENILLHRYGASSEEHFYKLIRSLGIESILEKKVSEISQGQAQRAAIARALVTKPKVLLADEPTSSLDDKNCAEVIKNMKDLSELSGSTLLVATHDARIIPYFDQTYTLNLETV